MSASRGGKTVSKDIRKRLINAHETDISFAQMTTLYDVKKDNFPTLLLHHTKNNNDNNNSNTNEVTLSCNYPLDIRKAYICLHLTTQVTLI